MKAQGRIKRDTGDQIENCMDFIARIRYQKTAWSLFAIDRRLPDSEWLAAYGAADWTAPGRRMVPESTVTPVRETA